MQKNDKPVKVERSLKEKLARWYSFNKQKIPFFFLIISVLAITATLDFKMGNVMELKSHIDAITKVETTIVAFYLFVLNMVVLVQLFMGFSFSKKRSPFNLIFMTILTLIQSGTYILYATVFLTEHTRMPSYQLGGTAVFSIVTIGIGTVLMVIATIFAWIYVDWKYVKIED